MINPDGWSGNCAQTVTPAKHMVGPGRPLDPAKCFIIIQTAMGSPGSSSPSVSTLGLRFPRFPRCTGADMVSAQHGLVTEKLGIRRLAGVIAASMGGYQIRPPDPGRPAGRPTMVAPWRGTLRLQECTAALPGAPP